MLSGCRPLTDEEIEKVKECFEGRYVLRDKALFIVGLKTGYRISELLSLRVRDVLGPKGEIADYVTVERRNVKKKTQGRTVPLHPEAKEALKAWLDEMERRGLLKPDVPVFLSQKKGEIRALDKRSAWRILKNAFRKAGLSGKLATHTLRKTFARKVHEALGRDLFATQIALGHKNIATTVRYLSTSVETINQAILRV